MAKRSTPLLFLLIDILFPAWATLPQKFPKGLPPFFLKKRKKSHPWHWLFFWMMIPAGLLAQSENCTNGIDDDGDGLLDCYDADCTCTTPCADFFYSNCPVDCYFVPPCSSITLAVQWISPAETGNYPTVVAGDMDADGVPEIVVAQCEGNQIFILDGKSGAVKRTIISPTNYAGGTAPAIADLDRDGFGEIVLVGEDRYLRCWKHNGTLLFQSAVQVGYVGHHRFAVPNIADFDHNGWAEINIGNQVFSGQTGALLASGTQSLSTGEHPARIPQGVSFPMTVAMDVLPNHFCPDCEGLEIVAGNQVMSVNLQTGTVAVVSAAPAAFSDGYTSVADFDRDGDLDAVVQGRKNGQNTLYVWDLQTPTILREFKLLNNWQEAASRANIADLDGDGKLDVVFIGYPWMYALKNDFSLLWTLPSNDVSSVTTTSIFDFCGDGSPDVICRSETHLMVLNGATGQIKWQDVCRSATHIESPLVLDVDADGQTEIIIACETSPGKGAIFCFQGVGTPVIASRKVWNQHAYFNTNINDDLSVPRFQQNPHLVGDGLPLNAFLNQYFNPTFPAPDGRISIQSVLCRRDSLHIEVEICNLGDAVLPANTPISCYQKNPTRTAAQWLSTGRLKSDLPRDECRTQTLIIPRVANDSVFFVLNDDHTKKPPFNLVKDFPTTPLGECNFKNNLAGFYFNYQPATLELGPDTLICDKTSLLLNANGRDFVHFLWQDGSTQPTLATSAPQFYAVTVTDRCGISQSDTRHVGVDSSTVVSLGADRAICAGETFYLAESGFDFYSWKPALFLNCTHCAQVEVAAPFSGNIILEAGFFNGCKNTDTVYVHVRDTFYHRFDTTVCFGRRVRWNGVEMTPGEQRIFQLQSQFGCDSTVQVHVRGTSAGTFNLRVDTSVCLGKVLTFNGVAMDARTDKIFRLSAITGCDSVVQVFVAARDTFATHEHIHLCEGETADVFGQSVSQSGVFKKIFTAKNGCDSTHTVSVLLLPTVRVDIESKATCPGESDGALVALPSGGLPPFHFVWNVAGATQARLNDLPAGRYSLTVSDANDCTATAQATVETFPPIQFSISTDSVRCHGEKNGRVLVASPDPSLLVGIDDQPLGQVFEFKHLPAGRYRITAQDRFGCSETHTVEVPQPDPLEVRLPKDTVVQLGDSLPINILTNANTALQFYWQQPKYLSCEQCLTPVIRPLSSFRYFLEVRDARGCRASDDFMVEVHRLVQVFVPNTFSPQAVQDDNTRLTLYWGVSISAVEFFQVYDRWGNLVYEIRQPQREDFSRAWDGKWRGQPVQPGVFAWKMKVVLADGSEELLHGTVSVL